MDYNKSPLRLFFTIFDGCLKFFGFSVLQYPSRSFKISTIGLICFLLSFSYSIFQCILISSATLYIESNVSDEVKKVNRIVGIALAATLISTILARIINLLLNLGLSKRIMKVTKMIEELDFMVR